MEAYELNDKAVEAMTESNTILDDMMAETDPVPKIAVALTLHTFVSTAQDIVGMHKEYGMEISDQLNKSFLQFQAKVEVIKLTML